MNLYPGLKRLSFLSFSIRFELQSAKASCGVVREKNSGGGGGGYDSHSHAGI